MAYSIKVLVVDDVPEVRMAISMVLLDLGHSVRTAQDGFSALAELRQQLPEIIISDLNMPGMCGFEFLSVVRRRFPLIRVIAMSGMFSGKNTQPGVPADAFHEKGMSPRHLVELVQQMSGWERSALELRTVDQSPIWVSVESQRFCVPGATMLTCPECLRIFVPSSVVGDTDRLEAKCAHCRSLLSYVLIASDNPARPYHFQHRHAVDADAKLNPR